MDELTDYAEQTDDQELRMGLNLLEKYNNQQWREKGYPEGRKIRELYKKAQDNYAVNGSSKTTLTTAHSSKGLEYDKVTVAGDFPDMVLIIAKLIKRKLITEPVDFINGKKPELVAAKEEANLYYVAITRARYELDDMSSGSNLYLEQKTLDDIFEMAAPQAVIELDELVVIDSPVYLLCHSGEYANNTILLLPEGLNLGRDSSQSQLVFSSKDVSRNHATVTLDKENPDAVILTDNVSTNGTFSLTKDGTWSRISGSVMLENGSRFRIANVAEFEVKQDSIEETAAVHKKLEFTLTALDAEDAEIYCPQCGCAQPSKDECTECGHSFPKLEFILTPISEPEPSVQPLPEMPCPLARKYGE